VFVVLSLSSSAATPVAFHDVCKCYIDAAKVANTLLGCSRDDQQALLEVIADEDRESDGDKEFL